MYFWVQFLMSGNSFKNKENIQSNLMKSVRSITLISLLIISLSLHATHERAGEITFKHIEGLTYEIKIVTYTFTPSPANRPELTVNWGDGTTSVIPRTEVVQLPDLIQRNVYTGLAARHTYPGPASYLITLEDPNRNYGILNIPNSVNVTFFIQTLLVINSFLGPNNSPELLIPPIDVGCVDYPYVHNPGAYDIDGDSLSYKLVPCRGIGGQVIPGYVLPSQVDPQPGRTFTLDSITGAILWNSPSLQGEYNFAFIIEEWRNGIMIGYVTRDMQVNIIACDNNPPEISVIADTCVRAGDTLSLKVVATDVDGDVMTLTGSGQPLLFDENPAEFIQPIDSAGRVTSYFSWAPDCNQVRNQPYQMFFKAEDHDYPVRLTDIEATNITVIAPPPDGLTVIPTGNKFSVVWNKTACVKAKGYRLYRKQGHATVEPGYCQMGPPPNSGFERVYQSNTLNDTVFLDDNQGAGLIHGNLYCYIVTVYFFDGAESYIPDEVCSSLKKDVPIITHVSVAQTGENDGTLNIGWSKPTEFDTLVYPGPYQYTVYRSTGTPDNFEPIAVLPSINDTSLVDQGVNTKSNRFYYRVELADRSVQPPFPVGVSAAASSVFLTLEPTDNALVLTFSVEVPWINYRYDIYRFNEESLQFDSVGYTYTTTYEDIGLENNVTYRYFVQASGEYSISGINYPLINSSQINEGTPIDNEPPCTPVLTVTTDCEQLQNVLKWIYPADTCPADVMQYRLYYATSITDSSELLMVIDNPFTQEYIHGPLNTIAGCYSISAIDSIGNESAISVKICVDIDSCSLYSLPNVFTPNNDQYNDFFRPFPYTSVEKVELQIFNRWGRLVYKTNDPEINWDGKNMENRQPCPDGVYFVTCEVYELRLSGITKRTLTTSLTIIR